ncbi:hypothetical protein TNCV_3418721 [Trichonephila clavipes]|nr:hypothetical protein TNCV_3418721 [Trichonephila clavipes]
MVTNGTKMVFWGCNKLQTNDTVTRKVSQGHDRASTPAQDRYLALRTRRHRLIMTHHSFLVTLLISLEEEFPGKQSTTVLQRLIFIPAALSGASL